MAVTAPRTMWQTLLRSTSLTRRPDFASCYACCEAGPSRILTQRRSLHGTRLSFLQLEATTTASEAPTSVAAQGTGSPSISQQCAQPEAAKQSTSGVSTKSSQAVDPRDGTERWKPNFSMSRPPRHTPQRNSRPVCTLTLRSYNADLSNLTFYTSFAQHAAHAFGLRASSPSPMPIRTSLRTVPRSPFIHKPSQENFIKKEHGRYFKIYDAPLERVQAWLGYLHENGLPGVMLKTDMYEYKEVGFGSKMTEEASMQEAATDAATSDKVKQLAADLLAGGLGSAQTETAAQTAAETAETLTAEQKDAQTSPQ